MTGRRGLASGRHAGTMHKMQSNNSISAWASVQLLNQAFREQQEIMREVHALAAATVRSPPETPAEFAVALGPLPDEILTLRRNLFSTLFQSTYHLMGIAPGRRSCTGCSINCSASG